MASRIQGEYVVLKSLAASVRVFSMRSMAGITFARLGVDREKKRVASLKI